MQQDPAPSTVVTFSFPTITRFIVTSGTIVLAGSVVAIIETMKMQVPIKAVATGIFTAAVAIGAMVAAGDNIGHITPQDLGTHLSGEGSE